MSWEKSFGKFRKKGELRLKCQMQETSQRLNSKPPANGTDLKNSRDLAITDYSIVTDTCQSGTLAVGDVTSLHIWFSNSIILKRGIEIMESKITSYRISDHSTICFTGKPASITMQSNQLYSRLNFYRAKVYLQSLKSRYGRNWGFDVPVLVK